MSSKMPQNLPGIPSEEEIVPLAQRHIAEHRAVVGTITETVHHSTSCFNNALGPIIDLENSQAGERAIVSALRYAASEQSTQAAVEDAERIWLEYSVEVDQNINLFQLLQAVKRKNEDLDDESRKYLDRFLMRYTDCGHGVLDEAGIQTWHKTNQEIEALCTDFNRHIRELNGDSIGVHFTEDELEGVPAEDVVDYPPVSDGRRRIPLRWGQYVSILRFAHNPETRRRIQLAWGHRLQENVPILRQIITKRHENARRRGYPSHAASRLPYRMAESTEWVDGLLEDLSKGMISENKKHVEKLRSKKEELSCSAEGRIEIKSSKIEPWDIPYYNRRVDDKPVVDDNEVMEYFPFQHTLDYMLKMFATYLQLKLEKLPDDQRKNHVWSPDVDVWSVWDDRPEMDTKFVGYLYIDVLERPNKYKGNQAVNLQPGYVKADGARVYPVSTLMCNFTLTIRHGCPLLRHRQVISLFHELGHCMHDLVARTKYVKFHGYEVCLEFGEAIAMMLENWCWIKEELQDISCHYTQTGDKYMDAWAKDNPGMPDPPKKMTDQLVDELVKSRRYDRINALLSQLRDSMFDLAVHNPPDDEALASLDETKLLVDLDERFSLCRRAEPCYMQTTFSHLVSGYDAGYFAYVCANVFAEDMFQSAFAGDHRNKITWDRFRREVLEYGGSRDERQILEGFLGHEPSPEALLKSLSIEV